MNSRMFELHERCGGATCIIFHLLLCTSPHHLTPCICFLLNTHTTTSRRLLFLPVLSFIFCILQVSRAHTMPQNASPSATTTTSPAIRRGGRKTVTEVFPHLDVLRQDGSSVSLATALKGKQYVLFYFAAHYLPSCQRFTPYLADFYAAMKASHHEIEIVFVSDDRSEWKMMEFFQNRCSNYVFRRHKATPDLVTPPPPPPATATASLSTPQSLEGLAKPVPGALSTTSSSAQVKSTATLRERLHPEAPVEIVTTTTTTTMSYNSRASHRSTKAHRSDEDEEEEKTQDELMEPVTHTTTKTTTTRSTAQEVMASLESDPDSQTAPETKPETASTAPVMPRQGEKVENDKGDACSGAPCVLPGHKPRLSAISGYVPREPIASGHGNWLALRYRDSQGAVGKWLRRHYKVRSAPRLLVVECETGRLLVSEGRPMVLRDPLGAAFPWPGADQAIQAERGHSSEKSHAFLWFSIVFLCAMSLYLCKRVLLG